MPYISGDQRGRYDPAIDELSLYIENPGQLNYVISRLCDEYIKKCGEKYENFNAVMGVLTCSQLEYYRRMVGPYEDKKIVSNGDVFHRPSED